MAVKEKIRIRLQSYDAQLIDAAAEKIVETAKHTGARVSGPIPLPTDREIVTVLRATHKYKDSREQFERRTHKAWTSRSSCKRHSIKFDALVSRGVMLAVTCAANQ